MCATIIAHAQLHRVMHSRSRDPRSNFQREGGIWERDIAAKVMAASVNKEDQLERLQSRVDQQSTLIEMLKQRADKTQHEVRRI